MPLFNLFIPYAVRTCLLEKLSAYDAAKLDLVLGGFLDARERKLLINPLRDLVFNAAEVQSLEAYGMRLLLLGNDVIALRRRLQCPQQFIHEYGHSQKLQIYLFGYCPVMFKTTGVRDRLLNFSLFGTTGACNAVEEIMHMKRLKARITNEGVGPDSVFIMSLGAPNLSCGGPGVWLRVPTTPDCTVDLKIYLPSLHDRERGEISFPWCEAWYLSRCALRKMWLLSYLQDILCMTFGVHTLSVAHLTSSGIHTVGPHGRIWSQRQIDFQAAIQVGEIAS